MSDENLKIGSDSFALDATKHKIDEDGFLHVPITAARVGIFDYPETGQRRFFPPEVLKNAASSLDNVVVTREHPAEQLVTVKNIRHVGMGFIKAGSRFDGQFVRGDAVIQDESLINDIIAKRVREVSSGYRFDDDGKKGKNEHGEFDTSLIFKKYNHVAAVSKGRAGENVKFQIDKKGKNMAKIKQKLPKYKIGNDDLLQETTVTFDDDTQLAIDAFSDREQTLINKIMSQNNRIESLESSLAVKEESLENSQKAQDSMVSVTDLSDMTAELLDVRQIGVEMGINELKTATDAHDGKLQILKSRSPVAYKDLEKKKRLQNKTAVDSAFSAFKENKGFHKEVHYTTQALKNNQGHRATQQPHSGYAVSSFEHFPRS